MRIRKLLVCATFAMFTVASFTACGNEEKPIEATKEAATNDVKESETDNESKNQTFAPEDIKLRNKFIEAEAKELIISAESEIEFDNTVFGYNQLVKMNIGGSDTSLGHFKPQDLIRMGYVDNYGNKVELEGNRISGFAISHNFDAYINDKEVVDRFIVSGSSYKNEISNLPDIALNFTELEIKIGDSKDSLKGLGTPSLVMKIDDEMVYYWQVESNDGNCCVSIETHNGIVCDMDMVIY